MTEVGSSVRGVDVSQFQGGHSSCGGVLKQAGPLCLRTSWIQLAVGEVQDLGEAEDTYVLFATWRQLCSLSSTRVLEAPPLWPPGKLILCSQNQGGLSVANYHPFPGAE